MRKTAWIDVFRLIRSTKTFFITMIVVTALAVMSYTGISFATQSLSDGCEQYYDENRFYDLQLGCIYGFDEEKLSIIRETSGVDAAQSAYYTQEMISIQSENYVAEFYTQAGELNKARLQEGTLPQAADECVIETALMERFGLQLGDTITLSDDSEMLTEKTFKIVGAADLVTVFVTDDFYNRGVSDLGDGQVTTKIMVADGAFAEDAVQRICYVTIKDRPDRGSDEYTQRINALTDELLPKLLAAEKATFAQKKAALTDQITSAEGEYNQGTQALEEADEQLASAQSQLDSGRAQLEKKKQQLNDGSATAAEQQELIAQYDAELASYRATLDSTKSQLNSSKQELDKYGAQLSAARSVLDDNKAQLDASKTQLDTAETQLSATKAQLNTAQTALNAAETALTTAQNRMTTVKTQLDAVNASLESSSLDTDTRRSLQLQQQTLQAEYNLLSSGYSTAKSKYDSSLASYESANAAYQENLQEYQSARSEYAAAKAQYDEADAKYQANYAAYQAQLDSYNNALTQYQAAETEYNKNAKELANKKAALASASEELSSGSQQIKSTQKQLDSSQTEIEQKSSELESEKTRLAEAKKSLDEAMNSVDMLPDADVFSAGIYSNPSYATYKEITHGTDKVVTVLCILLLAIATLVCFTTISRMVTEQHRLIGTQKALGFRNGEIYAKYIAYVLLCTILGGILGLVCSYTFLQEAVFKIAYGKAFIYQDFEPIIEWKAALLIVGAESLLMCLSAVLACSQMLQKNTIDLLNSNIRSETQGVASGKNNLPLSLRMTLRNLKSNPQIFLTTLISVFGCTVLMISVLTVRHGMGGIADRQFNELQHYDGTLTMESTASAEEISVLRQLIENAEEVEALPVKEKYVSYELGDETQYATLICLDSGSDYESFLEILDGTSGAKLSIPDDGVLICKKMAENNDLSTGDELDLTDSTGKHYTAHISGIFDRNIGMAILCSADYYSQLMNSEETLDQYYLQGDSAAISALLEKARNYSAYCSYADAKYYEEEMNFKVACVNDAVLLIMGITCFLSLFVLSNLASMNIRKKEKEIVTMKVLGFPRKRIHGYVFWECMVMCLVGLVLGVVLGGPIGDFITRSIEMKNLQDIRGISISACLIGGAINCLFFTLSNLFSLREVDKIKMTGSAREE